MPENFVGVDMTLYRNTGTFGSPVWDLIDNVHDLRVARQRVKAAVGGRRAGGTKQYEPGGLDLGLEWNMLREEADLDFQAIESAFLNKTLVELAFANGPIATSGTKYTRCEMKVFGFDEDESDDNGVFVAVQAAPCKSSNAPSKVTAP